MFATILIQRSHLVQSVDNTVRHQTFSESSKIAKNAYLLCASTEARNQKDLTRSLSVAHELVCRLVASI